jgi:hypothetical protein
MSQVYFEEIFTRLSPLVGSRVYPLTFPQDPDLPEWPAIRYTPEGGQVWQTSCGDADSPDIAIQIDLVCATWPSLVTITQQVLDAMSAFSVPCILQSTPAMVFDDETKSHRSIFQFILSPSNAS